MSIHALASVATLNMSSLFPLDIAFMPASIPPSTSESSRSFTATWLAVLLSILFALTAIPRSATGQQNNPFADATITLITGEQIDIGLDTISDGLIRGSSREIRVEDVMSIDAKRPAAPGEAGVIVYLAGGGRLPATGARFSGETFQINTSWGNAQLAPDNVAGILFDPGAERIRFDTALANRSGESDLVIAVTADGQQSVAGLLESIDDERLMLNFQGESRPITLTRVVGIVIADLRPAPVEGTRCVIKLVDGGTIHGALVKFANGKLNVEMPARATLQIPWSSVSSISLVSSSVAWLSELEPLSTEEVPLATLPFTWQRDASVEGNPLALTWPSTGATRSFARGIGTRSASRLEFANTGGYQRLVATVGIDSETNGHGACEVGVWGDGIELWSAEISGDSDPVPLNVEITGMNRLTLVVRHGKNLDLGDHVDWAEARFVKTTDGGGNTTDGGAR